MYRGCHHLQQVSVALALGRPCLVFAFSGSSDLAELRLTPPPHRRRRRPAGRARRTRGGGVGRAKGGGGAGGGRWAGAMDRRCLRRLLDFLACSFGGGTDVAGPLRRALDVLEEPRDAAEAAYSGADLLLVSDGELPEPPLDAPTHARLRRLQATSGLRVSPYLSISLHISLCLAISRHTSLGDERAARLRAAHRRASADAARRHVRRGEHLPRLPISHHISLYLAISP